MPNDILDTHTGPHPLCCGSFDCTRMPLQPTINSKVWLALVRQLSDGEQDETSTVMTMQQDIGLSVDLGQARMNMVTFAGAFVPSLCRRKDLCGAFRSHTEVLEELFVLLAVRQFMLVSVLRHSSFRLAAVCQFWRDGMDV